MRSIALFFLVFKNRFVFSYNVIQIVGVVAADLIDRLDEIFKGDRGRSGLWGILRLL